ncbi:MAG: GNAT family N-acetyltransferase [Chloroflexi bacterium]|nr:GNAT family N-acetyltransferase [Chloroflexota bacterium]
MTAPFDLRIAHTVTEIDQFAWDHLAVGQPFASYRWYQFGEKVLAGITPVYILLSLDGQPVARSTFWLTRQEPWPAPAPLNILLSAILRRWPLLICRAPVADYSGFVLPTSPLRDRALMVMVQAVRAIAQQHHVSYLLFDWVDTEHQPPVWPDGFEVSSIADAGTALQLHWPDFESYLGSLSKSMRKDYHRHLNRARDAGIEIKTAPVPTRLDDALPLIRRVEQEHGAAPKIHAQAILENAALVPAVWLTAEIGERLVGCGLLLFDGDACCLTLLGLDYDVRYAYFQLFYAAIRAAIESGARTLYGGSGAYDLKERLGFEMLTNNHIALVSDRRLFRQFARWMS